MTYLALITAASTTEASDLCILADQAGDLARAVRDHHLASALSFMEGDKGPFAGVVRAHLRSAENLLGLLSDLADRIDEIAGKIEERG